MKLYYIIDVSWWYLPCNTIRRDFSISTRQAPLSDLFNSITAALFFCVSKKEIQQALTKHVCHWKFKVILTSEAVFLQFSPFLWETILACKGKLKTACKTRSWVSWQSSLCCNETACFLSLVLQNTSSNMDLLPSHEELDNTGFRVADKKSMLSLIGE